MDILCLQERYVHLVMCFISNFIKLTPIYTELQALVQVNFDDELCCITNNLQLDQHFSHLWPIFHVSCLLTLLGSPLEGLVDL